jgi:hypothetical protein
MDASTLRFGGKISGKIWVLILFISEGVSPLIWIGISKRIGLFQ